MCVCVCGLLKDISGNENFSYSYVPYRSDIQATNHCKTNVLAFMISAEGETIGIYTWCMYKVLASSN